MVKNYDAFVRAVTTFGIPKRVSFDHDLAEEHYRPSMYNPDRHYNNYYDNGTFKEKTGFHCAKWLVEYCIKKDRSFPEYFVHTMNPIGRENIISYIESFKRAYQDVPVKVEVVP